MSSQGNMKFNWAGFAKIMRDRRGAKGVSLRTLGKLTGLNHATLSRAENGHPITAPHYLFLCEWCGVDPKQFTVEHPKK